MGQKIGSQPEAQDRYVKINDDLSELINLLRCEKLAFVNDYDLAVRVLGLIKIIYIGILWDTDYRCFQTDARTRNISAVAGINCRFDEHDLHATFLIIEFCNQCLCRF